VRHRHHIDQQIARLELQLDTRYVRTTQDATSLCQRLLGPRCQLSVRWVSAAVLMLLAVRKWGLYVV
jgi:hypothetical protein